jgi:endonuclease/exonuclease/phosphatase (EEP) superfamily protein YafD
VTAARGVLRAAALAAAVLIVLGFGGPLWFRLDALAHFRLHLAAAALLVGAVALLAGARRAGLAALAAAVLAVAGLGPALRPAERPAAPGPTVALTVAVANVDFTNDRAEEVERALAALDADVLVTLESASRFRREDGPLRQAYRSVVNRVRYIYTGNWLWTDLPLIDGEKRDWAPDAPAVVRARLALAGDATVDVLGLHFRRPVTETQQAQLDGLPDAAPDLAAPLIVLGDFNAAPWSEAVARAARTLGVEPVGGLRFTWRSKLSGWFGPLGPLMSLPIDHALVSPGVGVEWARTFEIPGSDHRGVLLRLQVPLGTSTPTASATEAKPSR